METFLNSIRFKKWENNRLVYYQSTADKNFWDNQWENLISEKYFQKCIKGDLDELSPYIQKYMSKEDRIIEAGCGLGRIVVSLLHQGFKSIEGIDYGEKTINQVKQIFPDLPIKVGNVLKIDKPDNYYHGYISLGVVEHNSNGPEPFLNEAYRVLEKNGFAFISVPYVNPLRKIKSNVGFFNKSVPPEYDFYQYAFQKSEFIKILQNTGFKVIDYTGYDGLYALREEFQFIFSIFDRLPGGYRFQGLLKKASWINKFGHMILFICKKD